VKESHRLRCVPLTTEGKLCRLIVSANLTGLRDAHIADKNALCGCGCGVLQKRLVFESGDSVKKIH
jgi:hypothetical protein